MTTPQKLHVEDLAKMFKSLNEKSFEPLPYATQCANCNVLFTTDDEPLCLLCRPEEEYQLPGDGSFECAFHPWTM